MQEDYSDIMRSWTEPECSSEAAPTRTDDGGFDTVRHQAAFAKAYHDMTLDLQHQLLAHIHAETFDFFENLIIDVVLALGFAGRRRDLTRKLGRSGDGGVDGVVELDELGLDAIYLQAKRIKPNSSIGAGAVRDFLGSLDTHKAVKGIFVTTGTFTASAIKTTQAASKRVVLLDGMKLAQVMLRHSIGSKVVSTFQFKELDLSYFTNRR